MIKTIIYLSLICVYWLLPANTSAQKIDVTPIPINDKLPTQTVNLTFQDKEGYIWFGTTEGISKYDGYRVMTFKPEDYDVDATIASNNVISINEVEDYLLLGTENGLFLLDKRTYKTSRFPDKHLDNTRINRIIIDRKSRIWLGTDRRIYVYHQDFSSYISFHHDPKNKKSIPEGTVNSILEDTEGNIWVCFWNGGLHRYDEHKKSLIAYPKIGNTNNPFKIFQDNRKQFWICTWNDGLYLFNPKAKGEGIYREIIIKNKRRIGEKEATFYNIVQDDVQHYIWTLSFSGISALKYFPDGTVKEIDLSYLLEKTANNFNDIYKDSNGTLWLAETGEGLSIIDFNKPNIRNFTLSQIKQRYGMSPNLTMMYEDAAGKIWFNQSNVGLGLLDPVKNNISIFSDYPSLKNIVPLRSVSCAIELNDEIWIGSTHEPILYLFKKDKEINLIKSINLRHFVPSSGNPLSLFKDKEGNLWIATTNGLLKKSPNESVFKAVAIPQDYINGIAQDAKGDVWIATRSNGIFQLHQNEKTLRVSKFGKTTRGLNTDHIEAIDTDDRGDVWIGTRDSRLISYQIFKKQFRELVSPLYLSNHQILDVVCYNKEVWISTSRHIFRVNPNNKIVSEYAKEDGINVNMFAKKAFFIRKKTNEIYFSGNRGISVIKASDVPPTKKRKVVISDIKLNNKSVIIDSGHTGYDFKSLKLTLNPEDHNLEINFSALEYLHPYKIRYAYKLEGVDKDWIYTSGNRTFATYNNLGKGNYRFVIKATDINKTWSSEVTELAIYKKPAFYESWMAYILYTCFFVALVYYIIQFMLYRFKLRSDLRIAQIEKEKADDLAQTKLKYFTNISHDLLTPLTIISCLIDDVEITNNKHLPQFDKMRSNLNRLKRLLQQILDFRKIESGNMNLKISKGDIVKFIEEICTIYFSPLVKKKGLIFTITPHHTEPNAYFDADKIDKIIFNLLSNAFKYTPEGGKIDIDLAIERKDGHAFLMIRIKDNGTGIPADEIDKIFIQFYNNKNAGKNESNGIGLALTKDLIELHHGYIYVESEVNKGTCFTIQIPIDRESYQQNELKNINEIVFDNDLSLETSAPEIYTEEEELHTSEKLNLLLVEDNEDLLATVKSILSKSYHVLTASNGKEALRTLQGTEIDLIISDIMMPEMDGLEFCRTLKADVDHSHIPIILLTAKNSVNDRVECYNSGADAYISKPFDLKVLDARINSFILNKRIRQTGFKTSFEINIAKLDYPTLDEKFLNNAIKIIEDNLNESDFEVVSLADKLNMSKSTLYRKVKILLGLSPSELIKNIRLKHACQMMSKDKSISVSEVAFSTGFSDPRYFATCFKAEFGLTPTEYQKQNT